MGIAAFIALLLGLLVGAAGVWLWARGEIRRRDDALAREAAAAAEKLALVERTKAEWETQLRALTSDALERSSQSLLDRADERLKPIRDTLDRFDEEAKKLEAQRVRTVTAIGEELKRVAEGQDRLRSETGNLVTALRRPDVRGRWGEMQLRRVLELAGMLEHCDFISQESQRDADGRLQRPDVVVRLAGGKSIVVDAKAPFDAYADAITSDDPDAQRAHLARHASQVRDHIGKLSAKEYWKQFESAPEFVVMFVDEGLYRAALEQDPSLFEAGVGAKVIIASPATLVGLLLTAAYTWQQENVAQNAREIAALGRELYDRIAVFTDLFGDVGKGLDRAVRKYNEAVGSLDSRLLVTARRFPGLGAGTRDLPSVAPVEQMARAIVAAELVAAPESTGQTSLSDAVIELPPRADAA
jgi:DNA recombination protein RmuC